MKTIIVLVYLAIGVLVAVVKDYLGDVGSLGDIINLLLAILLWPLVLLGVEFNLDIGGDDGKKGDKDNGGNGKGDGKNKGALVMVGPALAYARAYARQRLARRASDHA